MESFQNIRFGDDMRAGSLRNTISIENFVSIKNSFGEKQNTWINFQTLKCSIESLKESDTIGSDKQLSIGVVKFRIRYLVGIDLSMRLKFNDTYYEIIDIENPYGRNKELIILAKKVS